MMKRPETEGAGRRGVPAMGATDVRGDVRGDIRPAHLRRRSLAALLGLALITGALAPTPAAAQGGASVGAVGRIQPQGGVLNLGLPDGQLIERVLVKEGDTVRRGDVLLVLADRSVRESDRALAAERLRLLDDTTQSRLRVAELERESARSALESARAELAAIEGMDPQTVAPRERRLRQQQQSSAEHALRVAEARLADIQRSIEPDRRQARAQLEVTQRQLERTQLVAPAAGVVIEVPARAGTLSAGVAVKLADTSVMQVVADVFEGDLSRIQVGGKARINNAALGSGVTGTVQRIGRIVDPGSRLAKVTLQLDKPSPADRYIGMQVEVSIDAAPK